MSRALGFIALLWFISAAACSVQETRSLPPPNLLRQTIVARVQQQIQAETERHLSVEETALLKALSSSDTVAADFKRRLALQSLTKPWAGMEAIESHAMLIAEMAAESEQQLPALIDLLEAGMDRTAEFFKPPTFPPGTQAEELTMFLTEVLEQAYQLREKALRSLDQDERQFLYDHAAAIAQNFTPHVGVLNDATTPMVKADRRFVQLVAEKVDYAALIASAQTLARLANHSWLRQLTLAFQNRTPLSTRPKGVTGDVLLARQTSYGTIIIGGSGPNTYDLDHRVSLVIDLGGDDTYRGAIAAAADLDQANSVVIDLSGNDTYNAAPLGLATGRLGVGLLVDQGGDDVYQLPPGAGGTGFGGLGIVLDEGGNDLYMGTRFTQGTAVGGLGLILDEGGNDRYTSYGYAVGFGGPLGLGAVIDVKGDDLYQCGERFPSVYNPTEAPTSKPGDEQFQYDCFGIGTGSGKRVLTAATKKPQDSYNLAGGWGMVLDLAGNDRYRSSNFSQGCGYFFGIGLKLDLAGNDDHVAARYSHASGAHHGIGLFIDAHGEDHYASTGPVYNGAAAWDFSVMLAIDADQDNDLYELQRSTGLGEADHHAWGVFIEEGGADRYLIGGGMGTTSDNSVSIFFDLGGLDTYEVAATANAAKSNKQSNGRVLLNKSGGMFFDR